MILELWSRHIIVQLSTGHLSSCGRDKVIVHWSLHVREATHHHVGHSSSGYLVGLVSWTVRARFELVYSRRWARFRRSRG